MYPQQIHIHLTMYLLDNWYGSTFFLLLLLEMNKTLKIWVDGTATLHRSVYIFQTEIALQAMEMGKATCRHRKPQ